MMPDDAQKLDLAQDALILGVGEVQKTKLTEMESGQSPFIDPGRWHSFNKQHKKSVNMHNMFYLAQDALILGLGKVAVAALKSDLGQAPHRLLPDRHRRGP